MLGVAEKFQVAFEKLEDEKLSYRKFFRKDNLPSSADWDTVRLFSIF